MLFGMSNVQDETISMTLEDRQAIVDATIRYCWAIDTRAYGELNDVFTEDVIFDYAGRAPTTGVGPVTDLIADVLDRLDLSQHMLSNHQIEISPDGPRSRCYFHAQHVREDAEGGANYIVAGIYTDLWRKTPDGWRSCRRTLEVLWTDGNPAVVAP
jgi:ketosteroid isomerase-like protein